MILAQWGNLKFEISSNTALLLQNFKIKAQIETEEKASGSQKYAEKKASKPLEIDFQIILSAQLGMDVRGTVDDLTKKVAAGNAEYFYASGKKLFTCKMVMKSAETEEIKISPGGTWIYCAVNVTLVQGTVMDYETQTKPQVTSSPAAVTTLPPGKGQSLTYAQKVINDAKALINRTGKNGGGGTKDTLPATKLTRNYTR